MRWSKAMSITKKSEAAHTLFANWDIQVAETQNYIERIKYDRLCEDTSANNLFASISAAVACCNPVPWLHLYRPYVKFSSFSPTYAGNTEVLRGCSTIVIVGGTEHGSRDLVTGRWVGACIAMLMDLMDEVLN